MPDQMAALLRQKQNTVDSLRAQVADLTRERDALAEAAWAIARMHRRRVHPGRPAIDIGHIRPETLEALDRALAALAAEPREPDGD